MTTPFRLHVEKWQDCTRCNLCHTRTKVVLFKGNTSCDVLYIGEAPGASEDILGYPFKGPAGQLLDKINEKAYDAHPELTRGYTNLVACIPLDDNLKKVSEPDATEIVQCSKRLQEIYEICRPRLIVCVGDLADKWLDKVIANRECRHIKIYHPARILRSPVSNQSLMIQKCIVTIATALEELDAASPT